MSKINVVSLSGECIFTCEDKLLLCHFQILNSLCQENKISIKKIFLMLIGRVSVPNTHYSWSTVLCWYFFDLNILHSGLLPRIIHFLHTSVGTRKKWMKLNSWAEFTSHFPYFSVWLTLMSPGKLFLIYSGMGNTIYSCAFNTVTWHLPCLVR